MTVSSFWSPFGPSLIVVVPFCTNWNQVPVSGTVSTSVIKSAIIKVGRMAMSKPLNAQSLTTLIPRAEMFARTFQMSSFESNVGNQYRFVPTYLSELSVRFVCVLEPDESD